MRKCKCGCGASIDHKHPNAKFLSTKHKDRFHNLQPHRIERSKKYAKPKVKIVKEVVRTSRLEELLDQKLNHPFSSIEEDQSSGW